MTVVGFMKLCGFLLILFYFAIPAIIKMYPPIIVEVAFLNKCKYFAMFHLSRYE